MLPHSGMNVSRPYPYYECSGCGNSYGLNEVVPVEACPDCGDACELKHDCPGCTTEMTADYDKETWTCPSCGKSLPLKMGE